MDKIFDLPTKLDNFKIDQKTYNKFFSIKMDEKFDQKMSNVTPIPKPRKSQAPEVSIWLAYIFLK